MTHASSCPESVLASIAWYPDGLSAEERGAVESHAADCRHCRDELAFIRGDEEPAFELPDSDALYARVLERIESHEGIDLHDDLDLPSDAPASLGSPRRPLVRPLALAAGLAIAVLAGAIGGGGARWFAAPEPTYETASASTPPVAAGGPELEIVFRGDATADEIRSGLASVDASFVSGPSKLGVYRVRLVPGADVEAAVNLLRGDGRGVAALVEPATG